MNNTNTNLLTLKEFIILKKFFIQYYKEKFYSIFFVKATKEAFFCVPLYFKTKFKFQYNFRKNFPLDH